MRAGPIHLCMQVQHGRTSITNMSSKRLVTLAYDGLGGLDCLFGVALRADASARPNRVWCGVKCTYPILFETRQWQHSTGGICLLSVAIGNWRAMLPPSNLQLEKVTKKTGAWLP